ncbi:MAG: T9SS type A sorting domain-containing protein [Psychroserpens sp.]|nr:T9SS type A sorting domain-containing protein [Psychroserpens sp.]
MKTKILLSLTLCFTVLLNSQNVWTGNVDDSWANENNWSGNVPEVSDDVLIPPGFVVTIDIPANIRSIEVQGDPTVNATILNVSQSLIIAVDSEFEDNVVVNWVSGDLIGPGILLNSGTINLSNPSFDLGGSTVLNNPGVINLINGGNIGINTQSVLNNSGTGIIDFQTTGSSINEVGAAPNTFNNFGTIKTSFPDPMDSGAISGTIINTDGVFQIDSGTLDLNTSAANFMGGQYNVASGAELNWNGPIDAIGILSGSILGTLNWVDDLSITTNVVLQFTGNGVLSNQGGEIVGGGTITNESTIEFLTGTVNIEDGSTLDNNGILNFEGGADLRLDPNSTLNNNASGVIEIFSNSSEISSLGVVDNTRTFNNSGLLRVSLPNPSDTASVGITFNNNNGTIDVTNGNFNLNYFNTVLNNGTYNISSTGSLGWLFPLTAEGTLSGNLDGTIDWRADLLVPTNATFNFTGNGIIDWIAGDLDGGGTFNNENTIVKTAGGSKRIENGTTFNNNGEFRQIVGGTISIGTNSVLNNNSGGIIDLEASSSGFSSFGVAPNVLNNQGTIISDSDTNNTVFSVQVNNTGIIDVVQNIMLFNGLGSLTNNSIGIIKGQGVVNLPSGFINDGIISPGASPGNLTFVNDYNSSNTSVFDIELNGTDQGVNYDLITIDGDADLEGTINVSLGFNPSINDEFVVLETDGAGDTINTCNLPNLVSASFGGFEYDFDVICRNNNELVLAVTNETLSLDDLDTTSFNLYPNPSKNLITVTGKTVTGIKVYDLNGRFVAYSKSNSLSIKNLNNGVYILKISNSRGEPIIRKVIKH